MTIEEKQKAIDALKISVPIKALTQEEFNDYIQALNKIMNWLEQELTTRNCFGCKYSKDNHRAGTEECHLCMWENQYTPTTKNNLGVDCVSRKEVEKLVYRFLTKGTDENIAFYEHFLDLPSVTPIRPKGHWISHREHCENLGVVPSGLGAYEWCSNCDCGIDVREWHRNHYNYCPNCGADMSEVDE